LDRIFAKNTSIIKKVRWGFPVIFSVFLFWIHFKQDLIIFPGSKADWYSDKNEGGKSLVHSLQADSAGISYAYTMHSDFKFPYLAVFFSPRSGTYFDLSDYDFLDIDVKAIHTRRIPVLLNSVVNNYSVPSDPNSFRPLIAEFDFDTSRSLYSIPLSDFLTPSWWYSNRKITDAQIGDPEFSKISSVCIQQCHQLPFGVKEEVRIKSIRLTRNNFTLLYYILSVLIAFYGIAFLRHFKLKTSDSTVMLPQHKLDLKNIEDEELEKLITFLGHNYSNPDLSLEIIQMETGINESKINNLLKKHFQSTFKKYLNKLRVQEGKRLLLGTDRQVLDIAFKIGYSNVTHFNRVFKEQEDCSPNEFRRKFFSKTEKEDTNTAM
jgi:AraC-like DNA-binding protein